MKKPRSYYEKRNSDMCANYLAGASVKDIAEKYGVTPRHIRNTLSFGGVRLRQSRRTKKTPQEILRSLGLSRYSVRKLLVQVHGVSAVTGLRVR